MPEISRDEMGRRVFQLKKQKAVESSVEKIRRTLGAEWASLSSADVEILKFVLEEMWVSLSRGIWEQYSFTRLKKDDVDRIVAIGRALEDKKKSVSEAIEEFNGILSH